LPDESVVEEPAHPKRLPDRIKGNQKTIIVPKKTSGWMNPDSISTFFPKIR
jgi:hypothetical protein